MQVGPLDKNESSCERLKLASWKVEKHRHKQANVRLFRLTLSQKLGLPNSYRKRCLWRRIRISFILICINKWQTNDIWLSRLDRAEVTFRDQGNGNRSSTGRKRHKRRNFYFLKTFYIIFFFLRQLYLKLNNMFFSWQWKKMVNLHLLNKCKFLVPFTYFER